MATPGLDATDRRSLMLLQQDAAPPLAEIAAAVGLTTSPCRKRSKRLEQAGVIRGRVAVADRARLGLPLAAFVEIEARDHSPEGLARLAVAVAAMPEVLDCWRIAGDVHYLLPWRLIAAAPRKNLPRKNLSSRVAMEQGKGGTPLPIP